MVLERSPIRATEIGDHRYDDRLDDLSPQADERYDAALTALRQEIEKLGANSLQGDDLLTRDLLFRTIDDSLLTGPKLHGRYLPISPLEGPHLRLPLLRVAQPFRNADDFENWIKRLSAFPKQIDDVIANMTEGMSKGVVAPKAVIERVLPQLRIHIVTDAAQSELFKPLAESKTLDDAVRERIKKELSETILTRVVPAYKKLLDFLETKYIPAARATVGIGQVPGGDKMYEEMAYLNTTVKISPEKIHEIGLTEVARIRGEMAKIQKEVGFKDSLDQFLEHMRSDPKFRFQTGPELYAAADKLLARAKSQLPKLFGRLPKADCVMKEMEAFRAPQNPVAYYNPAPEDGSRPGYYYINLYKPEERLRFTLEALTYHEAVPGHHLQITLDQENTTLPKFRRYGSYTAYVEGWALYTEKLGYEIGGYQDPYSRFGQLTFEMWRACRLVVDTGMHLKGWSRQQAIDYMAANTSLARIDIENEIDRYISWPGQALGYKIGELRILALRHEAEQKLGGKFDVRAFHDALLSGGAMPIDMLEKRMNEWIEKQGK
ncbi:MAG: DUF885 domain-containing protein [Planctomycetes bacterium]|nr:DUF885 domain-containing protein [Planctomycetota bacterium]